MKPGTGARPGLELPRSREIIEEMRAQSTANAEEIRVAVEEGKRNLARLAEEGKGLVASAE